MNDRMSTRQVEQALFDLGRHLAYPDVDVTSVVVERVAGVRPLSPPSRTPRRVLVLAAALLSLVVGGMVIASPGLRAAIARLFTLPGVRIELGTTPSPSPPTRLDLGRRVTLEEAQREAGFAVAVPAALGEPDAVYLDTGAGEAMVSLVWPALPGLPETTETGVGAVLTQFRARPEEDVILKKLTGEGIEVTRVVVDGDPGFWIEGPHTVVVVTEDGRFIEDRARTAGNTLLWSRGDVTFRLETNLDRTGALAIARTTA
jgi:hypothetical protein